MKARYRHFDVPSLQQAACKAVGATTRTAFTKIGEGNYNKAYKLELNDGQRVIAKIPHPNAGPKGFTTASEVATMEFARTVLNLPVPKVLAWSADDTNEVGADYIIMEEAKGTELHEVWQQLPLRAKCDIIKEIVDAETKMLSVSFDQVESLYFIDSGIRDWVPETITTGSTKMNDRAMFKFCIGSIVRREFWEKERYDMRQYQDLCESERASRRCTCCYSSLEPSATQYLESVTRREIDWIKTFTNPDKAASTPWQYTSDEQSTPETHVALLRKFLSAIPLIVPTDADLVSPRCWHPKFHAGNIYVNAEGHISSIIDWQGAWMTPAFIGANPTLLLDYGVDMMIKLPDDSKQLDDAKKEQLRYQVAHSIMIQHYGTMTAAKNPLMYKVMRHPHGQTLKQLEAFAGETWNNYFYPFQHCLISVEREWEHFYADMPCPYHFTSQEVQAHYDKADTFNKSQDLWKELSGVLTNEGYTNNDTFDQAVETVKSLQKAGLDGPDADRRDEFERATRWVVDLGREEG